MKMDFKEYEKFTESTDISNNSMQFYLDGMSEEGGELSGVLKRVRRGDYDINTYTDTKASENIERLGLEYVLLNFPEIRKDIVSEIGDRHWYTTRFLSKIGVNWNEVMDYNKSKLVKRKEDGTIMGHGEERK